MDEELISKLKLGTSKINVVACDGLKSTEDYDEIFTVCDTLMVSKREQCFILLEVNKVENDCHIAGVYKSHQGISDAISNIKTMCSDDISHKVLIFDLED